MGDRDRTWLASQRWFRSKLRPIATVAEIDRADLGSRAVLTVLEVAYQDGGNSERYLVPLVDGREPQDGEGAFRAITRLMVNGGELGGSRGRFVATPTAATAPPADSTLDELGERQLHVEQSNSSVVLGERLIVKLYRLLAPGVNPDVEVSVFLTGAGFAETPAVFGALDYVDDAGARSAAAMVQAFVPSRGDAWAAMQRALRTDHSDATWADGTRLASAVGEVSRRLHVALASDPEHPNFPVRPARRDEIELWQVSATRQLERAVAAVGDLGHEMLRRDASRIIARFEESFDAAGGGGTTVSRIHGDYHLGQLLARDDGGFTVIDFEGEPARPVDERRLPASPLRDVAGMLRSFDYAARTAHAASGTGVVDPDAWLVEARAAFLDAYGQVGQREQALLTAFEIEKACYEVCYEANNRPSWLWLPLAAVERLAAG